MFFIDKVNIVRMLWETNKKSNMIYLTVFLPMTLSDLSRSTQLLKTSSEPISRKYSIILWDRPSLQRSEAVWPLKSSILQYQV